MNENSPHAADLLGIELTLPLAARPLVYITRCPHSAFTEVNYVKSKHIKSKAKTKKLVFLKSTPNSKDISIKLCPDRTCSHPAFVSSLPSGKTMSLKSWQTAAGSWMLCGCFVDASDAKGLWKDHRLESCRPAPDLLAVLCAGVLVHVFHVKNTSL